MSGISVFYIIKLILPIINIKNMIFKYYSYFRNNNRQLKVINNFN